MTRADIGQGVDGLKAYISGKTSVFCGASGVGKSSLLNAICSAARAETGDISHRIGRGRNTTRHTELFPLDCGGRIADSPGFSLLDIGEALNVPCDELAELFPEFEEYRYSCRYRSCTHTKDDGCAVRHAVSDGIIPQSRHESYVRLYNELKTQRGTSYDNRLLQYRKFHNVNGNVVGALRMLPCVYGALQGGDSCVYACGSV